MVGIGEDESDLLAYVAALLRRVQAVDVDVSFRRNDQSVDHASEGRLAASVRTHDPDSLLAQSQIYLLKDRSFTEAVADVLEDDLTHRRLIRHHGLGGRDHRITQECRICAMDLGRDERGDHGLCRVERNEAALADQAATKLMCPRTIIPTMPKA